jgi:hypothetical protein
MPGCLSTGWRCCCRYTAHANQLCDLRTGYGIVFPAGIRSLEPTLSSLLINAREQLPGVSVVACDTLGGLAVREHKSLVFSHEITRRPFRKWATRNVVTIQRPDAGGAAGTLEPAALTRDFRGPGLLGHLGRQGLAVRRACHIQCDTAVQYNGVRLGRG